MPQTYGVEIEFVLPQSPSTGGQLVDTGNGPRETPARAIAAAITASGVACDFHSYTKAVTPGRWKIVTDASIQGRGWELVSPPLVEEQFNQIDVVCNVLNRIGARVNRSCGLHVHVGLDPTTIGLGNTLPTLRRLLELYSEYEATIDSFMALSRRADANVYCRSLRSSIDPAKLSAAETVEGLCQAVGNGSRNVKLNLKSYLRQ